MLHESQIPKSCDLCYANKEKCERAPGRTDCERCCRVGRPCESKRRVKRPGRPPRRPLEGTRPQGAAANASSAGIEGQGRQLCRKSRPAMAAYPPNRGRDISSSTWRNVLTVTHDLTDSQLSLLYRTVHQPDFVLQFLLGPSFCLPQRDKLVLHLLSSRATVLDGYLACALSFDTTCREDQLTARLQMNNGFKHAAAALRTLRSLSAAGDGLEMASCLILGCQLLHFAIKIGGGELIDICAQALSSVTPHLEAEKGPFDPAYSSFLTSLVMTETSEGFFKTRMPSFRLDEEAVKRFPVDGAIGISVSLLTPLHDLAVVNVEMWQEFQRKQQRKRSADSSTSTDAETSSTPSSASSPSLMDRLDEVEHRIQQWQPRVPEDLSTKYTATEVMHMMCQAQIMRLAGLLVAHRLRHPFGEEDDAARAMSSTILSQLDMAAAVTGKVPRCIDLPLIVSCMELEDDDDRRRRLSTFSSIGRYSGRFQQRIWGLIELVWAARRKPLRLHWYQLGQVIASIP